MAKETESTNTQQRLHAAQKAIRSVAHDGKNTHQGYRYTSSEAIIEEARAALGAAGLSLSIVSAELLPAEYAVETVNRRGEVSRFEARMILRSTFRLSCVDGSGPFDVMTQTDWPVTPEAGRPFDKAVAAARTASLGYMLRDLLLIPRGEDGTAIDGNDRDPEASAPVRPLPPRPPARVTTPEPRTREQVESIEAAFNVLGMAEAEWGPFAKKAAGALDPRSMTGAAAVLDALDKLITERGQP